MAGFSGLYRVRLNNCFVIFFPKLISYFVFFFSISPFSAYVDENVLEFFHQYNFAGDAQNMTEFEARERDLYFASVDEFETVYNDTMQEK